MRQFEIVPSIEPDSDDADPRYPQQEEQPCRSIRVRIILLDGYWIRRRHFHLSLIPCVSVSLLLPCAESRGGMMSSPEDADTNSLLPMSSETGGGNGNGVLRQGSKKLWRRLSREPTTGTDSHADLEAELEEDRTSNSGNYSLLNNLNNRQPARYVGVTWQSYVSTMCMICARLSRFRSGSNHDRLCNGSVHPDGSFTRKPIPILSHQNSFGSPPTLSPQNSIRSNGSSPRTPSPFNLTTVRIYSRYQLSCKIIRFLAQPNNNNNSNFNFSIPEVPGSNTATKTDEEEVKKPLIVRLYERFPRLKEREDYSLFILSPDNK